MSGLRDIDVLVDVVHLTPRDVPFGVRRGGRGRTFTMPLDDDPEEGLRRLWSVLRGERTSPEITHVVAFGGTLPLLAAPVYAAWLGAPLVTMLRGNDLETGLFSLRRRGVLDDAVRRSARVCVVASDAVERLRALHPAADVTWIPNGIDLDGWEATGADRDRALAWRRATVPDGRRVVGLVGQLKRKKGVVELLDGLAVTKAAETFHAALVGEAEPAVTEWLEVRAGPAGLSWSIDPFLDRLELLGRYPAFDLVAVPSIHDGMPNVALEAAALGIPVLSSDAGGLADLVEDGVTGIAFPAADRHGLADALVRAAAMSDDDLGRLGAGAAKAATAFDHRTEAVRYRAVLEEVAAT